MCRHGGSADDGPTTIMLDHQPRGCLSGKEHTIQIYINNWFICYRRNIQRSISSKNTGIINRKIYRRKILFISFNHLPNTDRITYITFISKNLPAGSLSKLISSTLRFLIIQINNRDISFKLGKSLGDCFAYSLCSTGYKAFSSFQTKKFLRVHSSLLLFLFWIKRLLESFLSWCNHCINSHP